MIDMHTHILPLVDDGAKTFQLACEMLAEEINNGVDTVILTPHFLSHKDLYNGKEDLELRFEEFKERVKDFNINLQLGCEIYYNRSLLEMLSNNQVVTLNKSKYILVEFNLDNPNEDIDEAVYNIICRGFKPIVAHVERYAYVTYEDVKQYRETGALIQVNSSSILGDFGRKPQKLALKLIKNGLVDFIASDCHSMGVRKPNLKECFAFVEKKLKIKFKNKITIE